MYPPESGGGLLPTGFKAPQMTKRGKSRLDYGANRAWAENLSIVLQIGLTMAGCIAFCFFIGLMLDRWLGLKGIFLTVFTILGVIGGGNVVYRQIMEIISDKADQGREPD